MTSTLVALPAAGSPIPVAGPMRITLENQGVYLGQGRTTHPCCFLFPGHGSQYPNMLKQLCASQPVVRDTFAGADAIYQELTGSALSSLLFCDDPAQEAEVLQNLGRPEVMQPVIYVASVAMYRLVTQEGIRPDLVLGLSLGEFPDSVRRLQPVRPYRHRAVARRRHLPGVGRLPPRHPYVEAA
jgi:hypothetical protein